MCLEQKMFINLSKSSLYAICCVSRFNGKGSDAIYMQKGFIIQCKLGVALL